MSAVIHFSASEVAILNDYIDQLFANLKEGLAEHDVNNVTLPNLSLRLDNNGQLNLTNGVLRDITSLTRDGDVEVTYSNDNNILVLILPIRFDDIKCK
ncbi:hypothetical protein NQ317_000956 [Molorchus minor]|uniref:Uncharacterized protein n=1 Tax=Molorchus minor TaxID=1323400 RepID=A0ABQ9IQG9_9CUCU|nr:hypothetical protein NQ317_000956 [Molorchus minor]